MKGAQAGFTGKGAFGEHHDTVTLPQRRRHLVHVRRAARGIQALDEYHAEASQQSPHQRLLPELALGREHVAWDRRQNSGEDDGIEVARMVDEQYVRPDRQAFHPTDGQG